MQEQEMIKPPIGLKLSGIIRRSLPAIFNSTQSNTHLIKDGVERVWPQIGVAITIKLESQQYQLLIERRAQQGMRSLSKAILDFSSADISVIAKRLAGFYKLEPISTRI